jgi:pilus assembly protein Flp/PilA
MVMPCCSPFFTGAVPLGEIFASVAGDAQRLLGWMPTVCASVVKELSASLGPKVSRVRDPGRLGMGPNGENTVHFIAQFAKNESGATAIEYALIAAFIFLVIVTAVSTVGTKISSAFATVAGKIL